MTEAKFSQPIQPMIQPYFGSRHPTNLPAVVEDISEEINESKSLSMVDTSDESDSDENSSEEQKHFRSRPAGSALSPRYSVQV